ncbi:MAG: flavodoxin family protein [Pseudomonadota bacterium]
MKNKQLLIVGHAPSPNTKHLCEALLEGAQSTEIEAVTSRWLSPFDCDASQVLGADALVVFTTENFGYMNGALKDWFERVYYPCLEQPKLNDGKPYALVVKAGNDGQGAIQSVQRIINGLKWKEAMPVTLCQGEFKQQFSADCHTLGLTIAASLDADII